MCAQANRIMLVASTLQLLSCVKLSICDCDARSHLIYYYYLLWFMIYNMIERCLTFCYCVACSHNISYCD